MLGLWVYLTLYHSLIQMEAFIDPGPYDILLGHHIVWAADMRMISGHVNGEQYTVRLMYFRFLSFLIIFNVIEYFSLRLSQESRG